MSQEAGSNELNVVVAATMRMHEAVNEADIFSAFYEACCSILETCGLAAYVVAPTRGSVSCVARLGTTGEIETNAAVERWILGAETFPISSSEVATVCPLRLSSHGWPVGGVVIRSAEMSAHARNVIAQLAKVTGGVLAHLRHNRISQMVLEALEQSEEAIAFYDTSDGVLFSNDAYHRVFPHYPPREQLIGATHLALYRLDLAAGIIDDPLAKRDPEAYLAARAQLSADLKTSQREVQSISGRTYIYTRTRSKTGASMSRRIDITEQAAAEDRLRQRERELHSLAFRDLLTGLFNRAFLKEQLAQFEAEILAGTLGGISVFMADLNSFKIVNDTYGHDAGDFVLKTIAQRLLHDLPDASVIVRLGGDEFVLVFEGARADRELGDIAERIISATATPIDWGDIRLKVGASIGIARSDRADNHVATILSDADFAMYDAKKLRRNAFKVFSPELRAATMYRLALVEDLRGAIARNEFVLYFQPQFAAEDTRLVGFEALTRWKHPTRGMIMPDIFIPILEEIGLIEALGEWVLRTACAEAARWPMNLHVAVNVSPTQFRGSRFTLILADTLMRSGLSPRRLELEITESVFLDNELAARAQLDTWKQLGVRIALDDFGHGYSSLGYLSAFPIDKIKIDRGFLGGFDPAHPEETAGIILRTVIELGRSLGMRVTAEGVETIEQLEFLRQQKCNEIQGFLLGRPAPSNETLALIAKKVARPAA